MENYPLHRIARERDTEQRLVDNLERVFQVRKYLVKVNAYVLRQGKGSAMRSGWVRAAGVTGREDEANMETRGQITECSRVWKGFGF